MKRSRVSTLENKLDRLFSRYVRDRDGNVCITCGKTVGDQNLDAGHFIGRSRRSLRWDPKNCHSQCSIPCNKLRRGAPAEYALAILDRYGAEELRRLMLRKTLTRKWTAPELSALIDALQRDPAEFESLYYETEL